MTQRAERGVLVLGVGRSGTSLAMQALQRLGVGLSGEFLPPNERNARGAFEDVGIEKRMGEIAERFGLRAPYLRPDDWREDPLVAETERWLAEHLGRLAADCGAPVFAVKYPVASDVLPMWEGAFARAGLRLDLLWATRNARDNVASFPRAFGLDPARAERRYLIRCLHLMEDLPPDAFLLPYEGWTAAPEAQIRALAGFVGAPLADEAAALHDLFDPSIDHGGGPGSDHGQPELDPLTRAVDAALTGLRGRAEEHFGPELQPLRALAARIRAAVAEGRIAASLPAEEADLRQRLAEKTRRMRRVEAAAAREAAEARAAQERAQERQAELAREAARAAERAKAAAGEAAEARAAYAALTRARDAETLARADREAGLQAEILRLREGMEAGEGARKAAEALAETKAVWARRVTKEKAAERRALEAARKELESERKRFEAERKTAQAARKTLETERKAEEAARKAAEAEIARMRASRRWRVGNALGALWPFRAPGLGSGRNGRKRRRPEASAPRGAG